MKTETLEAAEQPGALPEPAMEEGRRRWLLTLQQILAGAVLLGMWQLASGTLVDPFFISSPAAVARKLHAWIGRGLLFGHLQVTLAAMALGFVAGALAGFAVGFLFGRAGTVAAIFDPYVTALYSIPKIALAPLFIMWFGIGI